jgi:hypothetical protein
MQEKVRHSKYRNTGLIVELLTRQILADTLTENNTNSVAVDLLKEYFEGGTELAKEYMLYKSLMEGDFQDKERAEALVNEVLRQRKKLNHDKLEEQKHELVGKIKEHYPLKKFFQTQVDEYKELASVYKMFKSLEEGVQHDPQDLVRCHYTLLEHIQSTKTEQEPEQSQRIRELKKKSRSVRVQAQKLMKERFQEKYGHLHEDHQEVLRRYVNNFTQTGDFRNYVNERVDSLHEDLRNSLSDIESEVAQIKVKEALEQLPNLKKGQRVTEDQVMNLMMFQELRNRIQDRL